MTTKREAKKKEVRLAIEKFISDEAYRDMGPGGGYAEITDQDLADLGDIVRLLADLKASRDCDGDSVIEFNWVNRQKERMPYFRPMPYSHKDLEGAVEVALSNLTTATTEMNIVAKEVRIEKEERKRASRKRAGEP